MSPRSLVELAAAAATGLLLWASFPAPDIGWLALVALVPLLLVAARASPLRAATLGWVAGVVFFGANIWWLHVFGYLAWAGLTVVEALAPAAFFALVPATQRMRWWRVPLLAGWWAALELVRAHVPLGGFPWSLLGVSQHDGGPLLPLARVVGTYGLSAVIVAVNVAVASAIEALYGGTTAGVPGRRRRGRPLRAAGWLVVAAALAFAGLLAPGPPPVSGRAFRVAVIQGNSPMGPGDVSMAVSNAVVASHTRLTERLGAAVRRGLAPQPQLVIWGEGAIDSDPFHDPTYLAEVRRAGTAVRAPILAGATTDAGPNLYRTEALLFAPDGRLLDRYIKRRLVPFGEYVPGGSLMRRLVPATRQVPFNKVPGHVLKPMHLDGMPFGVLICYESVFPEDARSLAQQGARFIVVITDNSSWGVSPGSAQHLAASQLGAVEEGRTYVQAAVSGISAIVTPDGVAHGQTPLFRRAILQAAIAPRAQLTFYGRHGADTDGGLLALGLVALVVGLIAGQRRRRGGTASPYSYREPAAVRSGRT